MKSEAKEKENEAEMVTILCHTLTRIACYRYTWEVHAKKALHV